MATRAQMIADINASRPDPYAHLTEEQLLALLNHTDPRLRDAARQLLISRQPKESTTADLVNETRPAPKVETLPEPAPLVRQRATASPVSTQVPTTADQYSAQAHAIIADLNARRSRAGGEVPEAPAMMAEINRLLELGNRARNAPQKPSPPAAPEAIATPPETVSSSNKPMTIVRDFTLPPTNKERGAASSAAPPADNGWRGGKFDWDAANREVARRAAWDKRYGQGTYDYRGAAAAHMRNRAGMGDATEQELVDVMRQAQLDDLARQAAEEDAVRAHNARVAGLKRGVPASSPADLDPVEAAATEVTPDPQVGADMSSTDILAGPRRGTVRKWNSTTKRYDVVDASKPAPEGPTPFYGRSVPGPASIDGSPSSPSELFASQEDADAYGRRSVLGPDEAAPVTVDPLAAPQVNPRTGLAGSQRDIDMRRRGFVPVQGRDGGVTYMLEADTSGDAVGGPGRAGVRDDLGLAVNDDGSSRWEPQTRSGPLGMQTVYAPTDEFRAQVRDNVQRRSAIRAARDAERQKMVVLQAQATQRPMNFLNNPEAKDWARRVASEAMLRSGRPGATPLDVEGQQMGNMQNVMQQMATGYATTLQQNPQMAMLRQQQEQKLDMEAAAHADAVMDKMGYDPLTGLGSWNGKPMTEEERRRVVIAVERRFPGRGMRIAGNIPVAAPAPPRRVAASTDIPPGE